MPGTAKRILIVDDEPSLLKMLEAYLQRAGYSAVTAGSTEEAWAVASAAPDSFGLAVLDASMSGIPLEELAGRLLAANQRMRVIVASGYPVDISALEATAPGRLMFLHKPFSPKMLGNAVRRVIGTQETDV